MGLFPSKSLDPHEKIRLQQKTGFSDGKLSDLYQRFTDLDLNGDGYITRSTFYDIPDLQNNPLCDKIIDEIMDGRQTLSFDQFLEKLSIFQRNQNEENKLLLLFKMNDLDQDGYINTRDVYYTLQQLLDNDNSEMVFRMSEKIMSEIDHTDNGFITFDDFKEICQNRYILPKLDINFLH